MVALLDPQTAVTETGMPEGAAVTVPSIPDGEGGFQAVPLLQMDPRPDGTPRKVRVGGPATLTWTNSEQSAEVQVAHGLGVTPVCVIPFLATNSGGLVVSWIRLAGANAVTFPLSGWVKQVWTGSAPVNWLAIG